MNFFIRFSRLLHIGFILVKHGLEEIALRAHFFGPFRWPFFLFHFCWKRQFTKSRGIRIREALEELGPIFVKFGQLLSTRSDIVPADILTELTRLQDQVPPFSGLLAQNMIEVALKRPLSETFQCFELTPLASASIAQVHAAILLNGQTVVVKVLRPNIHKMIEKDIALLEAGAKLVHRYWRSARQFKAREVVAEFKQSLADELDLMKEAANASQLKRNFEGSSLLQVPKIYWDHTRQNILVMERVYGISVTNGDQLKDLGFNVKRLAEQAIEIFFTQVFRDCFFHADMHPGNLFISTVNPTEPHFIAMDFGIMGILSAEDKQYLAENLLAFFRRDYQRVAKLHMECGWVPPTTRLDEFESAIRAVSEPILEQPLQNISFGELLFRLFQMAARFQINVQPQLMLLQKTLMNIESLSRQLYPEVDIVGTAKPFLENWIKSQIGASSLIRKFKLYSPYWIDRLPELPNLLYSALTQMAKTKQPGPIEHPSARLGRTTGYCAFKDICIGLLLGVSLSLIWVTLRSYF